MQPGDLGESGLSVTIHLVGLEAPLARYAWTRAGAGETEARLAELEGRLRRLEGAWRGLAWLVGGIDAAARVRVRVLNAAWAEICRDLDRAAEFDQSQTFRKIYEEEFGSPGGEPYGLLVIDHELRHRPGAGAPTDDVGALSALAGVAAAAFAPIVLSASPALLQVDEFAALAGVADIASNTARSAQATRQAAADLTTMADDLTELVNGFRH